MGLANLSALIYLLSLPALVYIYYFSRKKKRVEISSIIPWRLLRESVVTSSLFRADLLFYLQLLLLLAAVLAACRPYWHRPAAGAGGRHLFLVMDRSASMQAMEGKESRWELAREGALRLLRGLRGGDRATLICAAAQVEVLASAEGNRSRLAGIVEGLEAADTPDRLAPAIELAISTMRKGEEERTGGEGEGGGVRRAPGELYVFTDRTAESLGIAHLVRCGDVHLARVGSPKGNIAITGLSVYRERFKPDSGASLFATVENFSDDLFIGSIRVRSEGEELAARQLRLAPEESVTAMLGERLPEGLLKVVCEAPDALRVDNVAYAMTDNPSRARVVLFTRDANCREQFAFLAAAIPTLELDIRSPAAYSRMEMRHYDLAIFHHCEPEEAPPANLLVILPPVASRLVTVRGKWVPEVAFIDWDEHHPAGKNLRGLHKFNVSGCRILDLPSWAKPVVISATMGGDIPLVLCGEYDGRRVAVTSFDTVELELKKADSMPSLILMLNLLNWLTTGEKNQIRTGEAYETLVPLTRRGGAEEEDRPAGQASGESPRFTVVNPQGRTMEVSADSRGNLVVADTEFIGRYRLSGERLERSFVANLCDRAESDLLHEEHGEDRVAVAGKISAGPAGRDGFDRTGLFLSLVLILLLLEWFAYIAQRRGWLKSVEG